MENEKNTTGFSCDVTQKGFEPVKTNTFVTETFAI
jgi:hypothetical protein